MLKNYAAAAIAGIAILFSACKKDKSNSIDPHLYDTIYNGCYFDMQIDTNHIHILDMRSRAMGTIQEISSEISTTDSGTGIGIGVNVCYNPYVFNAYIILLPISGNKYKLYNTETHPDIGYFDTRQNGHHNRLDGVAYLTRYDSTYVEGYFRGRGYSMYSVDSFTVQFKIPTPH